MVKGYKVFNPNWTCHNFQYKVGETYVLNKKLKMCPSNYDVFNGYGGFHFCKKASNCFNYYSFDSNNKVAEVIAHGEVIKEDYKCCTDIIEIVREIKWNELLELVNTGNMNTGNMSDEYKQIIKDIPNFDAEKFYKITGIKV